MELLLAKSKLDFQSKITESIFNREVKITSNIDKMMKLRSRYDDNFNKILAKLILSKSESEIVELSEQLFMIKEELFEEIVNSSFNNFFKDSVEDDDYHE